jgi:hypothetical protein
MNTVCRLEQLRVSNFVIAAFDAEALAYCSDRTLPCFAALPDDADNTSAAFEYGSNAFRALTKLKSVQVIRSAMSMASDKGSMNGGEAL